MKIAFIGGRNIHKLGGIENYMYNLASELVRLGHEPVVYCESDCNMIEWVNGFKVVHRKSVGGRFLCKIFLSYKVTISSLWNHCGYEVYHYNAWPPSLASWIPRLCGKKTIMQGHGLEWKRTKYSPFQQRVMKCMEWFTAKINTHLTMVSQEQTDYFFEHYNKYCTTIPTATNLPTHHAESDILRKFGITHQYYLYLGRLVQDKNPDYLIKSFIQTGIKDKQLVIAGDNEAMPEYVKYLYDLAGNRDNIIFTGAVYGADKEVLLSQCYAFCIPSTVEGLAITLLEAMSYGKICIASDILANREGLGESGVWCKPENVDDLVRQIVFVNNNYDVIIWQEEFNRRRVKEYFTWNVVAKKYVEFLNVIMQK